MYIFTTQQSCYNVYSAYNCLTGQSGRIFFWTHFRLSLRMATNLRMRSATPSVYLMLNMIE